MTSTTRAEGETLARTAALGLGTVVTDRQRPSAFAVAAALVFVASAAVTVGWCAPMSAMGMAMPGGWTMSMAWMRMPGQSWAGAAASFVAMWAVMMVPMMLPSLLPVLARERRALARAGEARVGRWTARVCAGYFAVWTALGAAVYPAGVALAALEMQRAAVARAVPLAVAAVLLIAGVVQLTRWKAHHLACCRASRAPGAAGPGAAWRRGVRLGLHCCRCCAGPTAVLLALGVMDLRAMAAIAAAITAERLAPGGARVARIVGAIAIGAGAVLVARAAGLG